MGNTAEAETEYMIKDTAEAVGEELLSMTPRKHGDTSQARFFHGRNSSLSIFLFWMKSKSLTIGSFTKSNGRCGFSRPIHRKASTKTFA